MRLPQYRPALATEAALFAFLCLPVISWGQTATISGNLSAFDVVNDSGKTAHGFEIQLEGAMAGDLYYTVFGGRYGNPTVIPYATGVYVRYQSAYDAAAHRYIASTPPHTGAAFSWQNCYLGGAGYTTSGCEHFGQSMRAVPAGRTITVTGRWLVADPARPGTLAPLNPPAAIPFASWFVSAPAVSGAAPAVVAQVEAPEPPEAPEKYGNAQWVKIYKTQLTREVTADELNSGNPAVVPESAAQIEVAWDILQASPVSGGNGKRNRSRRQNQGNIAVDTRAVIRRYEVYKYTGAYDAVTHQVACADGTCSAPSPGELGAPLSAQNTATDVTADSLTITRAGSGLVSGDGGKISCGNACAVFAANGTQISLVGAGAGTVFTGWSGACSGTRPTCTVSVNGHMAVAARFKSQFTLSVGRGNSGTVTGSPAGNDRALNCGSNCSAKFTDGTTLTLKAVPPAGKQFVSWGGACSGTAPTCTVRVTKDTSVQAIFEK